MQLPTFIMRLAAVAVVGAATLADPQPAQAFDWCDVCFPGETCGLEMPLWVAYCQTLSCGEAFACWTNDPSCSSGRLRVNCNYNES